MSRRFVQPGRRVLGFGLAFALCVPASMAQARGFHVLYSFTGGSDGANPLAGLIRDKSGNLYGTTYNGGDFGRGVAFKIAGSAETVLYPFYSASGDGANPQAGLYEDPQGNFFGTTQSGGSVGSGTVFSVHPDGSESVIHSFGSVPADGCDPKAGLLIGSAGVFYGTAANCGANDANNGVLFFVAPDGSSYSVIYSFTGGSDGAVPLGALITDAKGTLYGTASQGAHTGCTVFKFTKNGVFKVLYTFSGGNDGGNPEAGLVMDSAGNLYGTTTYGGASNVGVVFELTPKGHEKVLHTFAGGSDGAYPTAGLIFDAAGNLYGTTSQGGNTGCSKGAGCGTVFKLAPDGTETMLHVFSGGSDGANPVAGLIADKKGTLFGTAAYGGASGYGDVFEVGE